MLITSRYPVLLSPTHVVSVCVCVRERERERVSIGGDNHKKQTTPPSAALDVLIASPARGRVGGVWWTKKRQLKC
jgi:hypothetical protein